MLSKELIWSFLRKFRRHTLIISLSAGLLIFVLMMMFPAMDTSNAEVISASWPQLMKDMFGDPLAGFSDIYGWLELELFHLTFWVIFGVFASFLAANIIAKEYENKTIDLILSTPISRMELIVNRLIGLSILLFVSIIPVIIGCILGIIVLGLDIQPAPLLVASLNGFLLCLLYASVGLLISIFVHSQTFSILLSLVVFGLFFLFSKMLIPVIPALKSIAAISPFHYYDTANILIRNSYSLLNPLILFLAFIFLSLVSAFIFDKKDIIY
ncbi:MAG: ABC transporter permease subunit [Dehalococcoidales bacterium]|nr:ABC transporter permease subunit [Dehalococcoidales bacterium]